MVKTSQNEIMQQDTALLTKRAMQIHRGAARAAVLGVNDGLVSTLCIVLAVAAASGSAHSVLIAGFAGLIAGAISMAAGEWISVTSQVELFRGVLSDLGRMVKNDKEVLTQQLQQDYTNSGFSAQTAHTAANEVSKDEHHLTVEYAQNVMGINPEELGSPWTAAFSSFALFTAGALVALCPWFFVEGGVAIGLSVLFTTIGGLVVGGYVSRTSGGNVVRGALRQFFIIAFASLVTYGIGALFGAAVIG